MKAACDPRSAERPVHDDLSEYSSKEIGQLGEFIAALYLAERGFVILDRNYRCEHGEADIIARDPEDNALVFIEVKSRRARSLDHGVFPEEAVNAVKQARYRRIAVRYLSTHRGAGPVRFDAIGVTIASGDMASVHHVVEAFDWEID